MYQYNEYEVMHRLFEKKYRCRYCGKEFVTYLGYAGHINICPRKGSGF